MLTSISPVGEAGRGQRWWLTTTAYVVGATSAGSLVGLVAGSLGAALFGAVPPGVRLAVLAGAAAVGVGADRGWLRVALPGWHRQVNERWLDDYRGWVYGLGFGFQLGLGLVTIVASALTYLVPVAAALAADASAGAAIGAAFGLSRSLPLVATRNVRGAAQLRRLMRRLAAAEPAAARAAVLVQAATVAAVPLLLLTSG